MARLLVRPAHKPCAVGNDMDGVPMTWLALYFLDLAKYHTDEALFSMKHWWPGTLGYEVGLLHGEFGDLLYEIAIALDGGCR